jgi:hypothetical protein
LFFSPPLWLDDARIEQTIIKPLFGPKGKQTRGFLRLGARRPRKRLSRLPLQPINNNLYNKRVERQQAEKCRYKELRSEKLSLSGILPTLTAANGKTPGKVTMKDTTGFAQKNLIASKYSRGRQPRKDANYREPDLFRGASC